MNSATPGPCLVDSDRKLCRAAWFLVSAALLFQIGQATAAQEPFFHDRFAGEIAVGWSWRREEPSHWRTGPHGLEIRVLPGNLWGRANNANNILVRAMPDPAAQPLEITATLHHEPTGQWEQTNLAWFYDESHMVKLGQELVSGKLCVVMGREEADKTRTVGIVPLDAHTVQLRLLVTGRRIHGQYRTVHWEAWREVGDCDLPLMATPHLSLHCYQGPKDVNHWAQFEQVTVRRLATAPSRLEDLRDWEQSWKSGQPAPSFLALSLDPPFFQLTQRIPEPDLAGGKSDAEQSVFRQLDGSYGWTWDRRTVASERPNFAGLLFDGISFVLPGFPLRFTNNASLVAEKDVISRLEEDRGQHALCLQIRVSDSPVRGQGRQDQLNLWFDWQGRDATGADVIDGYRNYAYNPGTLAPIDGVGQHVYRLAGFRGAPPRVNLRAFLADAARRLQLNPATLHVWQLNLGNEIWNGSKGRTHVRQLDWIIDGQRHATATVAR
ncbi:MAG: hypothetical protein EXS37_00975 [Opitutus sp.]|nr:hypothetical protein [Opitutus sp.]